MIYLVAFALSTLLMYASGRCRGSLRVILAAMALALPCLLAGVRDKEVGVDVLTYAYWQYGDAKAMGLAEFMVAEASISAPGWNLLTWLVCHPTGSLAAYLTVIELVCVVPVYVALRRLAPGGEWAGWLTWLCLFYAFSMNGMRQSAALGFVLLSYVYVRERRVLPFLACVAAGCLFHQTAVFGLLLWPLVAMLRSPGRVKAFFGRWQALFVAVAVLAAVACAIAFGDKAVVALSVLKDSYAYQVAHLGANDVGWAQLYLLAVIIVAWLASRRAAIASDGALIMTPGGCCSMSFGAWRDSRRGLRGLPHLPVESRERHARPAGCVLPDLRVPRGLASGFGQAWPVASGRVARVLCRDDYCAGKVRRLAVCVGNSWDWLAWRPRGLSYGARASSAAARGLVA